MRGFAWKLGDAEVADVNTIVRISPGNRAAPVSSASASEVRENPDATRSGPVRIPPANESAELGLRLDGGGASYERMTSRHHVSAVMCLITPDCVRASNALRMLRAWRRDALRTGESLDS